MRDCPARLHKKFCLLLWLLQVSNVSDLMCVVGRRVSLSFQPATTWQPLGQQQPGLALGKALQGEQASMAITTSLECCMQTDTTDTRMIFKGRQANCCSPHVASSLT